MTKEDAAFWFYVFAMIATVGCGIVFLAIKNGWI